MRAVNRADYLSVYEKLYLENASFHFRFRILYPHYTFNHVNPGIFRC